MRLDEYVAILQSFQKGGHGQDEVKTLLGLEPNVYDACAPDLMWMHVDDEAETVMHETDPRFLRGEPSDFVRVVIV